MIAPTPKQSAETLLREKQVRQAEELLFTGPRRRSLAKELFWGRLAADLVLPYPRLSEEEGLKVAEALRALRAFCDECLDATEIDRQAEIPQEVIDGLGRLGVLGMTAPLSVGGRGFSQLAYCRVLEELGSRCSSTLIFVNAHHSIGMRRCCCLERTSRSGDGSRTWSPAGSWRRSRSPRPKRARTPPTCRRPPRPRRTARITCSMARNAT